jgi:hypothetical protein
MDTDNITFRKVYAKGNNNSLLSKDFVLTADGRFNTRWMSPSSLGAYSLSFISTNTGAITNDLSLNNIFYLKGGQALTVTSSLTNKTQAILYSKTWQSFYDINSDSAMTVLDNPATVYSTVNLSTTSVLFYPTLDSATHTLTLNTNPIKFLTGASVQSVDPGAMLPIQTETNITSENSTIRLLGVGDFNISSVTSPQDGIYFSVKGITSQDFSGQQEQIAALDFLSTTVPYEYRSTLTLTPYNSLQKGTWLLSTSYQGQFVARYNPFKTNITSTIFSTIGFPFVPAGTLGGANTNIIQTFEEDGFIVSIYELGNINNYSGDAYISSLTFSMAPFSSIINRNQKTSIQLSYSPGFQLPTWQTYNITDTFLTPMSTFISYGGAIVPGTAVETTWYTPNQPPKTNFISPSFTIDIPKPFVTNNYISNYTVDHYFPGAISGASNTTHVWPNANWQTIRPGLSTNTIISLSGIHNTATISIIGL